MNFFASVGTGWAIKQFAPIIVNKIEYLFERYVKGWAKKLAGVDDWLEEKTGCDIFPADVQEKYDAIVNHSTEFIEAAMTDAAKIRFILNMITRADQKTRDAFFASVGSKTWKEFLATLPDDLKAIISNEKAAQAAEMIEAMVEKLLGIKPPERAVIRASIDKVVAEKNANQEKAEKIIDEPSMSENWARMSVESQARQDALKK